MSENSIASIATGNQIHIDSEEVSRNAEEYFRVKKKLLDEDIGGMFKELDRVPHGRREGWHQTPGGQAWDNQIRCTQEQLADVIEQLVIDAAAVGVASRPLRELLEQIDPPRFPCRVPPKLLEGAADGVVDKIKHAAKAASEVIEAESRRLVHSTPLRTLDPLEAKIFKFLRKSLAKKNLTQIVEAVDSNPKTVRERLNNLTNSGWVVRDEKKHYTAVETPKAGK